MTNRTIRICAILSLFVCLRPAQAVVHFRDGLTHDIDYGIEDEDVWIDYDSPGMGTVVNVLEYGELYTDGGMFDQAMKAFEDGVVNTYEGSNVHRLEAYGRSRIFHRGGSTALQGILASDSSRVSVSGGFFGELDISGSSQVDISGGKNKDGLFAHDSSQVNISGGSLGSPCLFYDSSQVVVSGGSVGGISLRDSSQLIASDGSMGDVFAFNDNHVSISGGSISGQLYASGNSELSVSCQSIGSVRTYGSSQVNISGGTSMSHGLYARGSSQVSISGARVGVDLRAYESSNVTFSGGFADCALVTDGTAMLTIQGSDFAIDGTPVAYGELFSTLGGSPESEPQRRLTGALASGEPLNNYFYIGQDSSIVLAYEPTATPVLLVTPDNQDVGPIAGIAGFSVSNTDGGTMGWNAEVVSGRSWLSLTSGASGTDSGTIEASYISNSSTFSRAGTIRVVASGAVDSPKEVTVTQQGRVVLVSGTRSLPYGYDPDASVTVTLDLDVDDVDDPNWVIVSEYVPVGWTPLSATPDYTAWDSHKREILWVFLGEQVSDTGMDITYDVGVPGGETGCRTFSGRIRYTEPGTGADVTETIGGDTEICAQERDRWTLADGLPDFDGDGTTDLLWHRTSTGANFVTLMTGGVPGAYQHVGGGGDPDLGIVGLGDWSGDGQTDLLWRRTSTSAHFVRLMSSGVPGPYIYVGGGGDPDLEIVGLGDCDGNGTTDLLWHRTSTGANFVALTPGLPSAYRYVGGGGDPDLGIIGLGDCDGSGTTDLLWYRTSTGENFVTLMTDGVPGAYQHVGGGGDPDLGIVGLGDCDGSGTTDLLWHRTSTGANFVTLMTGGVPGAYQYVGGGGDPDLGIVGLGDYDGSGTTDLLWHRTSTGANFVTLMTAGVPGAYQYVGGGGDPDLGIAGLGDCDGDGTTDLLWHRTSTGANFVTLMTGGVPGAYRYVGGGGNPDLGIINLE